MPSNPTPDRHADARSLLTGRWDGILSTLAHEEAIAGYPFGSVVPFCLDRGGRPLLLISDIAQHTANLEADPRCALTVTAAGADVQASARLTVVARAAPLGAGEVDDPLERYERHFPHSRGYHDAHRFRLWRLQPTKLRYIGGFGDIRWIEPEEILRPNPFSPQDETRIVDHMNDDHADALARYAAALSGGDAGEVELAGIDAEGLALLADGRRLRLEFDEPVATPGQARERLVALARE